MVSPLRVFWFGLLLSLGSFSLTAQQLGPLRTKVFKQIGDTLWLDSLILVQNSVRFPGISREDSLQLPEINYPLKALIFNSGIPDSLVVEYRVYPYPLSKSFFHKDIKNLNNDFSMPNKPFTIQFDQDKDKTGRLLMNDGLNKNGNISRGISFGNTQDAVLNSNLNLQVSGKLTPEIDILMAATDNNIPFQADGTTAQLQEFDKVFIQLNNASTKMIVGDYQLSRPSSSYFMNFYKRAQGLYIENRFVDSSLKKPLTFNTRAAGAISRGKFSRQVFFGVENNQGPYRLRGADNEPFIIVLSGTEKIYIDGKLLERGQENDYIIDYNTGELTFTAKQIITKDKRIIAEFQYAERNYARSLFMFSEEISGNKTKGFLHFFTEQDNKNRALQQSLSQEQKGILNLTGDSLQNAFFSGAEEADFNSSDVFYRKTDSIVSSILYNDVYVYSTNPDSARYRVRFSNVGQSNGNYVQVISAANGKVYEWRAPMAGIPQGNFEPIILLVSPKQNQMLSAGIQHTITNSNRLIMEGVYTKNDINTLSTSDKGNDEGAGFKAISINEFIYMKDTAGNNSKLIYNFNYEFVNKQFKQIERFRNIEFERDWNRPLNIFGQNNQHIGSAELGFVNKKLKTIYQLSVLDEENTFRGVKHNLQNNFNQNGFLFHYNGSLLDASEKGTTSLFYRHKSLVSQKMGKIKIAYMDDFEDNKFKTDSNNQFTPRTYQFWEWEGSISNADSSKNFYKLFYRERRDKQAYYNEIKDSTFATSVGIQAVINSIKNNPLSIFITYRELKLINATSSFLKPDNTFLNRLEYNPRFWKGFITLGVFYETGYGLENRREFYYLEVAPGQGQYAWIDYNGDNIKQLNEFEIAQFPDQARYIRIFTPTNDYVKVLQNQLSGNVYVRPSNLFRSPKNKFQDFIRRCAIQTAFRLDNKTDDAGKSIYFNPLMNINDSLMIAATRNFRQSMFFNQSSAQFGGDYTYTNNSNKILVNGGIETRALESHETKFRINFLKWFTLNVSGLSGEKGNLSLLFANRNYLIRMQETENKLSYQPGTIFRISLLHKYAEKINIYENNNEQSYTNTFGMEVKYNQTDKGSLLARSDAHLIKFSGNPNSAVAYEMLNGLSNGTNFTWEISYQRNINTNVQISINYTGRKTGTNPIPVHIGGGSVRAYF